MGRLDDRREVEPPRRPGPRIRTGPTMGDMNISVPISFGLPIMVVGLALVIAASNTGRGLFWVLGLGGMALGAILFATGKRL